jgi:hypothetical protein
MQNEKQERRLKDRLVSDDASTTRRAAGFPFEPARGKKLAELWIHPLVQQVIDKTKELTTLKVLCRSLEDIQLDEYRDLKPTDLLTIARALSTARRGELEKLLRDEVHDRADRLRLAVPRR